MWVDGPGTIGPHPSGLERSGRRPPAAFLFRAAKPALGPAAEKSRWGDVAGSRARLGPCTAGHRSDPLPNRGRDGCGSYRENSMGIMTWLASGSTFSPAPIMVTPALAMARPCNPQIELVRVLPSKTILAATTGPDFLHLCHRRRVLALRGCRPRARAMTAFGHARRSQLPGPDLCQPRRRRRRGRSGPDLAPPLHCRVASAQGGAPRQRGFAMPISAATPCVCGASPCGEDPKGLSGTTLTIMALTLRACRHLAQSRRA